jgi:hypothetical protein
LELEVRLSVIEVRNLPSMDTFSKSDLHCKLWSEGQSPIWIASFTIQMFDKDLMKDDKMEVLQLCKQPPGVLVASWYPLQPTKACGKSEEIHLKCSLCEGCTRGRKFAVSVSSHPLNGRRSKRRLEDGDDRTL